MVNKPENRSEVEKKYINNLVYMIVGLKNLTVIIPIRPMEEIIRR